MILMQGVSCSYEGVPALRDVDLRVVRGDSVALLGPNGSGKSTLLKVLNGLVIPASGSYELDGDAVSAASLKDRRFALRFHQKLGFLFQNVETQLFCPSVEEEVSFGPRQMGLDETEVKRRTDDCLHLLGITHLAHRAPWHLSGGEKRLAALASILSLNPEVLTLDEPMNGLDPRTKRFLRDLLLSLGAAGKTIIGATHDFEYVRGLFSTAVVFSADHRIIRQGPFDEIVADTEFLQAHNLA